MMRENQSDSDDSWLRPGEYSSPWAARDAADAFGGSGDQRWYVAPGYGSGQDQGQTGGPPGGPEPAGYGAAAWTAGGPGEPPGQLRRRRGHWLVYLSVAVLAAGVGAGLTAALDGG